MHHLSPLPTSYCLDLTTLSRFPSMKLMSTMSHLWICLSKVLGTHLIKTLDYQAAHLTYTVVPQSHHDLQLLSPFPLAHQDLLLPLSLPTLISIDGELTLISVKHRNEHWNSNITLIKKAIRKAEMKVEKAAEKVTKQMTKKVAAEAKKVAKKAATEARNMLRVRNK